MTDNFDFENGKDFAKRYAQYKRIDSEAAFERFERRVGQEVHHEHNIIRFVRVSRHAVLRWTVGSVAVAAALAGVFFFANRTFSSSNTEQTQFIASIHPGHSQATLTTVGGKQVTLVGQSTSIAELAAMAESAEAYSAEATTERTMRVDVPRGGEYSITLSDGTTVHLNAESSLSFPSKFSGDARCVTLTGEGYFDVAHADSPFIVSAHDVEVKQYGTQFNVNAYKTEHLEVTLVRGSIGVSVEGKGESRLTPGRQAVVDGSRVSIIDVDAEAVASWVSGVLVFDNKALDEIAATLSRWYDVDIAVAPALRSTRFTGTLSRQGDLVDILDALSEITGMKYCCENKKIIFQCDEY